MKSYVFKFYELKDDALKSIETMTDVINKQNELIKALDTTESTYDFTALKDSLKESNENYENQIKTLNTRLEYIQWILDVYEKGKADNASKKDKEAYNMLEEVISRVFLSFGLVQEEE